jgi:hypothetical protein
VPLSQAVTGLRPGTVYEWQVGGRGHDSDSLSWVDGQPFDTFRFFTPASFWNQPASGATHPNSAAMMAWLNGKVTKATVSWDQYAVPLNVATNADPRVTVHTVDSSVPDITNVSWPAGVANSGDGDDNHGSILNVDTGELWDFWQLDPATKTANVGTQADNERGGKGDGNHDYAEGSARGSSADLIAGEMQPHDFAQGHIDHALIASIPAPATWGPVGPFNRTDHNGDSSPNAIPEGARLRLPASFDCGPYTGWQGVVCQALKRYGAIPGDNSGNSNGNFELEAFDVNASSTVYGHGQSYPWGATQFPSVPLALIRNMEVVQW